MPIVNTYKNYFHVGETVPITWTASSSNTDFYQYWLVIRNKSLNTTVFEGASGNAGDVNANRYSYKIPQKGEYTVTVYAVPYNNKETRQKEYTKTFYADTESKSISDDEYHVISAIGNDMTLDVSGTSNDNGVNVQIWSNLWNPAQTFNVKHLSNGCYTIIFKHSGKALDVSGGSTEIGANVQQYEYGGAPQQQWIIKPTLDGKWYNIISVHTGYYLTVANGNAANGTNVEMCPNNGSDSQKWKFSSASHVHSYSKYVTTKYPTCVDSGIATYICSCGDSYTKTIPALGHSYNSYYTIDTPATCTASGSKSYHCSRCNNKTGITEIPPAGHSFGDWKVIEKATYTSSGMQVRVCSKCGATETKAIAKLGATDISEYGAITAKSVLYTGKGVKPTVTVKNGSTTLKLGIHYTVSYKNNTAIGKATVTIKGVEKNGYTGSKTLNFNIIPANVTGLKATQSSKAVKLTWNKVSGAQGYQVFRYDGKKWIKVADTNGTTCTVSKLKPGTNYKFAVRAYAKSAGTTYNSAALTQNSTATKPGTPTLKATAAKKSAKLSWNKQAGANGYAVYMATSKSGRYSRVATVKGGAKVSFTKKGLSKGKTCYFKVAAYKTVGKINIYGSFSSAKCVKVK